MKVTPGDPSCQNATVPGVSILHEMQTLSGGGLTWSAAGSGPRRARAARRAPPGPREIRAKCVSGSNRGAQVYDPPLRWARKCMHGPRGAQASVCPVPSNSRRVHVPLAKTQSSAFRRNTLVPRPPARRQRGGKAPPPKRLPAPQVKPRAKCRQELHARPRELAPKKAAPAPDGEGADAWHNMWAVQ